ncbi:hypothetical protein [Allorhizocola rhizosphaerae]|uniref:hypothetical protein n=1 Tax=Allorhizocola rhizosphaerae TaxID=1872709 RepID=UPI0013C2E808
MAQQVQIVDAVRAGDHARHNRRGLAARTSPGRQVRTHPSVDQPGQAHLLGQLHHRHQPSTRHQIALVEPDHDTTGSMR